jgi:N-acetylglutamate synthase-like GNAT family acetyltransferase
MIKIIPFIEKYKDDVVQLVLDIYENELGFVGYERPDIYNICETYQEDAYNNFWLALNNGELVGTIGLLGKTKELAYLKRMVIKKEFRKKGLGKKLLQTALTFAKKQGFKIIYAGTVLENPNAIQFYKHYGFIQCNDTPNDITAADDSICLKLDLYSNI